MNGVREWSRHHVLRKIGIVFSALSLALLLATGVSALVRASALASRSASVEGTVVNLARHRRTFAPVVEFVPDGGAPVRFEGAMNSKPPAYRAGERVRVLYDPHDPSSAIIDSLWEKWFVPLLLGLLALPYLVLGTVFLLLGRRLAERDRRLREGGDRVSGTVVALENARAGKRRARRLVVEAREPSSGQPRQYFSNPLLIDVREAEGLVGRKVIVLVDPSDRGRYLVDLSDW